MKWPWVSRGVVVILQDEVNRLSQEFRRSQEQYHELLDKYHALKVTGAVTPMSPAPREVDQVTQAVIAKSRGNPILYKHYGTFVATQRALGTAEDEIAQQILHGVQDDAGVPL